MSGFVSFSPGHQPNQKAPSRARCLHSPGFHTNAQLLYKNVCKNLNYCGVFLLALFVKGIWRELLFSVTAVLRRFSSGALPPTWGKKTVKKLWRGQCDCEPKWTLEQSPAMRLSWGCRGPSRCVKCLHL